MWTNVTFPLQHKCMNHHRYLMHWFAYYSWAPWLTPGVLLMGPLSFLWCDFCFVCLHSVSYAYVYGFHLFSLFFVCLHSVSYAYVYGFHLFNLFFACLHSVSYVYVYGFRLFSLFFVCLHSVYYAYVYGFRLFSLFFVCLHSVSYAYVYGCRLFSLFSYVYLTDRWFSTGTLISTKYSSKAYHHNITYMLLKTSWNTS